MPYTSFLNKDAYPRGLRNNNPANLVITSIAWQGKIPVSKNTDGKFEQFTELRYGLRAMMRNIISKVNSGTNTVSKLISVLSPAFENNTAAYITMVANAIGISPNIQIDLSQETLISLCKIITVAENGQLYADLITDKDYNDAIAILGITLKKKVIVQV
ncbi:hypothetical protein [Flavobacterium alkalisoli]|uniref:hypothetical protein n=1 Tax=Flavobacterium alkalisoli TaxID=2602769 RepID=UPI003A8E021E